MDIGARVDDEHYFASSGGATFHSTLKSINKSMTSFRAKMHYGATPVRIKHLRRWVSEDGRRRKNE